MTNFLIDLKIHMGGDKQLTATGPVGISVTVKGGRNGTASGGPDRRTTKESA